MIHNIVKLVPYQQKVVHHQIWQFAGAGKAGKNISEADTKLFKELLGSIRQIIVSHVGDGVNAIHVVLGYCIQYLGLAPKLQLGCNARWLASLVGKNLPIELVDVNVQLNLHIPEGFGWLSPLYHFAHCCWSVWWKHWQTFLGIENEERLIGANRPLFGVGSSATGNVQRQWYPIIQLHTHISFFS